MSRIIVSVTNDLTTDQRVHRVCCTLVDLNYEVLLIGRKLSNSIPLERNYKTRRLKLLFNHGFLFYAEYNIRLFLLLLFNKKTVLLANDLDTLFANYIASKISGCNLVYDSHELFTEVPELLNKPIQKGIWKFIEKNTLPKVKHCVTVCNSIANYYNTKYNTNFKVVRNLPTKRTKPINGKFPFKTHDSKIILYQGALNIGRGLELMIDTMQYLDNFMLVIIGNGDIQEKLKLKVSELKLTNKIKFIEKLEPEKLRSLTPLADVGISLEENLGLNYSYALPNKIFDYIQAEVPILTSNLIEMKTIVTDYYVGEVVKSREPKNLANQIEQLVLNNQNYKANLKIAAEELIWENECKKLVELFN